MEGHAALDRLYLQYRLLEGRSRWRRASVVLKLISALDTPILSDPVSLATLEFQRFLQHILNNDSECLA